MIDTNAPSPVVRHSNGTEEDEFDPEYASYFTESNTRRVTDEFDPETAEYTIVATDDDGTEFEFTYAYSYAMVSQATFDIPEEEVTVRTPPVETEWVAVDGVEDPVDDSIHLDGCALTLPDDIQRVWNNADLFDYTDDFICVSGIDEADPVGRPFEVYFILIDVRKQGASNPVFRHENA